MALAPYFITALKRVDSNGNNFAAGAIITIIDGAGIRATIYSDAAGTVLTTNGQFACDSNGEKQIWVEAGIYGIQASGGKIFRVQIGVPVADGLSPNSLFRFISTNNSPYWLRTTIDDASFNGNGTYYLDLYGDPAIAPSGIFAFTHETRAVYEEGTGDVLYLDGYFFRRINIYPSMYTEGAALLTPGNTITLTGYITELQNVTDLTLQFVFADTAWTPYDGSDNYNLATSGYIGTPSEVLDQTDAAGFSINMTIPLEYTPGDDLYIYGTSDYHYNAPVGFDSPSFAYVLTSIEVVE